MYTYMYIHVYVIVSNFYTNVRYDRLQGLFEQKISFDEENISDNVDNNKMSKNCVKLVDYKEYKFTKL